MRWVLPFLLILTCALGAALFAARRPPLFRPAGVPAGAVNSGSFFEPGRWFSCDHAGSLVICSRFYASGGEPETIGLYQTVRPSALTQSAARFVETEDFANGQYYVRLVTLSTWDGSWDLVYSDSACVAAILAGDSERYGAAYNAWLSRGGADLRSDAVVAAERAGLITVSEGVIRPARTIRDARALHFNEGVERNPHCRASFSLQP